MVSFKEKAGSYRKFFMFMLKYRDAFRKAGDTESHALPDNILMDSEKKPEELVRDLQEMGPAFIKLGQLLSTRPDLLPPAYIEKLSELQNQTEEVPIEAIRNIFQEDIGVALDKAFEVFDEKPLATASIAQVHKAKLHSGPLVVIKVMKPGVREQIIADLEALTDVAEWASKHTDTDDHFDLKGLVSELKHTLLQELDFKKEAQNLVRLNENLVTFEHLIVPLPIPDFTGPRVLTMQYIPGNKATSVSPLRRLETDLEPLVEELLHAYLHQVVIDGFAHADPHPGNIYLTGLDRLALLDLGMVAHFPSELRDRILQILVGISNEDVDALYKVILRVSVVNATEEALMEFKRKLNHLVFSHARRSANSFETGRLILEINRTAADFGVKLPAELNILGKILLNLDQIIAVLAPDFNVHESMERYIEKIMQLKMVRDLKPENLYGMLLQSKELAENLPQRLNIITEKLANNELEIGVNAIDEDKFTSAFEKVANRITVGLVIASMIIGAALIMRIPTSWQLFGYPGLAIVLFLLATILGFYILYSIITNDK